MPRVVACGSREAAYDRFCTALGRPNELAAILLVDSEGPITRKVGSWTHLKEQDNWKKPKGTKNENAHLMVQCMEAWFFADKDTLANYFGDGFNRNALSGQVDVEDIPKSDIERGLKSATRQCIRKGRYSKGRDSFTILGQLDPEKVTAASPRAKRLIQTLLTKASSGS